MNTGRTRVEDAGQQRQGRDQQHAADVASLPNACKHPCQDGAKNPSCRVASPNTKPDSNRVNDKATRSDGKEGSYRKNGGQSIRVPPRRVLLENYDQLLT